MKKLQLLFVLFISVSIQAQTKEWTLEECVAYAIENNISIKQNELNYKTAEINKKDAIGNFLPSFNASASHSWNIGLNQNITTGLLENLTTQFTSVGLNSNIDIYKGLQNINTLRRAKLELLSNQYQLETMKDDISLAVINSFLQILFSKEQLKVVETQQNLSNQQLSQTQALVEAGSLPRGDILEIQATLATQQQQIVQAQNTIFLAKISLAQLLLLDDYKSFDIVSQNYDLPSSEILNETPESILEKAKEVRNDIKLAENDAEIAKYNIKIARGALQPSLSGFFSYSTRSSYSDRIIGFEPDTENPTSQIGFVEATGQSVVQPNFSSIIGGPKNIFDQFSENDGYNFGLSLNIPILNGFSIKNNVARSKINYELSKYRLQQAKLDLETNVYQAYNDAKAAFQAYEAAIATLQARELAYEYSNERYKVGLLNAFDFNQSQNQLEVAQSEVVRTKYDYVFKLKVLEYYFGIPITEFN